jgi:hypothetical protein
MRLAAIFLAVLSTPALALPPAGVYPNEAEHLWWECHVQPITKIGCCRASDGHVLRDDEWWAIESLHGGRHYQVRVGAKWFDVPAQAVINDFRRCGAEPNRAHRTMAKVWYAPSWHDHTIVDIEIRCFIAGNDVLIGSLTRSCRRSECDGVRGFLFVGNGTVSATAHSAGIKV